MPPPPKVTIKEDSDDDDLDDLDDILDEFQSLPQPTGKPSTKTGDAGASDGNRGPSLGSLDDDFARQLQLGMQDLLGEMQDSKELQDQFEHLVKELNDATAAPGTMPSAPSSSRPSDQAAANFQDRIKQTMDRMKSSGAEVDAAVADSEADDFLSEMLKQMQGAAGEGESDEDFSSMLLNMMEQLTSKEILYEPMKELNGKYPEWLRNNESKQPAEDLRRYREQYGVVKEIVAKFEEPEYRDESDNDREFIIDRMQKMQAAGAPPTELMGEMGQGLDIPPDVDSNCAVQ
ncbi:Pex19 protein family-domain-containing protein [Tuber brumale]|nr:Pex19 protein family-domain-containing protein [Tuber brumale]